MESKSSMVLGLLSISLCSVSANPMPQNFKQQNYRSNNSGIDSFKNGGSGPLQSVFDAGNNNYNPTPQSGQSSIANSRSSNAEPFDGDGQLSVMLRIPQWFARFGVSFVLEPNRKFARGSDENNANANNECQGAACGLVQEPASSSAADDVDEDEYYDDDADNGSSTDPSSSSNENESSGDDTSTIENHSEVNNYQSSSTHAPLILSEIFGAPARGDCKEGHRRAGHKPTCVKHS